MPKAAPAADTSLPDFLNELTFHEPTIITASNGDYLDIEPGTKGGPATFTTVPISRLRHAFRIHRTQDERTRRWKVELEAVPLAGGPMPRAAAAARRATPSAPPARFDMDLAYHGCMNFELSVPAVEKRAAAPQARGAAKAAPAVRSGVPRGVSFSIPMDVAKAAFAPSTTNFPTFTGDSKRAFDFIASKAPDGDPHNDAVDSSWLSTLRRPDDIPDAAWMAVMDQLNLEVHYRRLCSEYFQAFREFTQNVFIANSGLVNTIGSLMELEGEQSKIIHIAVEGMFSAMASGVGALGFTGAGVVSGALKVGFEFMLKDQGPGARELAVAYGQARDELAKRFNGMITQAQRSKVETFKDWGKLKMLGESMVADGGKNRWPGDDSALRAESGRLMEVQLWKDLLKVKWHHMTPSDAPSFMKNYSDADARRYEDVNRHYWVEFTRGRGAVGFKEEDGFLITNHWLGYGGTIYTHHEPSREMCDRLFSDKLKVTRKEVFTESSWGLARESFLVQRR